MCLEIDSQSLSKTNHKTWETKLLALILLFIYLDMAHLFLSLLLGLSICCPAQAFLALRDKSFNRDTKDLKKTKVAFTVEDQFKKAPKEESFITYADMEAIVPTRQITAIDTAQTIGSKILQKATRSFIDSDWVKNNPLFKTVKSMEQSTQVGVAIQESKDSKNSNPRIKDTEHNVNFNIQAFKQEAIIKYKGFIDSVVEYKMNENAFNISFEEKLSENSSIALRHQNNSFEQKQWVQYQIRW